MAVNTIEWASNKRWNFVRGCRRVSPGCGGANGEGGCYAEGQANRFAGPGGPYEGLITLGKHGPRWNGNGRFVPEKLAEPLSWRAPRDGSRHRIFVNSMSDLFFEEFSNEQIAAGFGVMAACPQHDFLILTKRAKRMREWFSWLHDHGGLGPYIRSIRVDGDRTLPRLFNAVARTEIVYGQKRRSRDDPWMAVFNAAACIGAGPLDNVWLGVSAEDQQRADDRIPHLLATPAAVRFVSAEPLIGPITIDHDYCPGCREHGAFNHAGECQRVKLSWLIVGSESGHGARPMQIEWAESLRDQCASSGVAFFTKQIANDKDRKGGNPEHWPPGPWPREFPR